jgi:TPR repeat protein
MLKDIVDNTWDFQCKAVHMTDPETGEDMVGSSFEAQRTSPRDLSEEESGIVKKLSDILLSRIDSLSDEELFQSTQMNYIDTVPYVKRLSEHNHPTALCRYAWILYHGEETHGVQRDLKESKKYLSRAVERACEITNGLKAFYKSEAKEDTKTYE